MAAGTVEGAIRIAGALVGGGLALGGGAIGAAVGDGLAGTQTIAGDRPPARDRGQGPSVLLPDRRPGGGHVLHQPAVHGGVRLVFAAKSIAVGSARRTRRSQPAGENPETESIMTTAGIFLLPNGTFFVELIVFLSS